MNNSETPEQTVLDFAGSVTQNIAWIKQLAELHDCSQGIAASAALMTMTMMDHHRMSQHLAKLEADIATLSAAVCPSNS
jgi:hypothetical protein